MEKTLSKLVDQPKSDWMPVTPEFSCASCYWAWDEALPLPVLSCHLMPRQVQLVNGTQVAALLPPIGDKPHKSLCAAWKSREVQNG